MNFVWCCGEGLVLVLPPASRRGAGCEYVGVCGFCGSGGASTGGKGAFHGDWRWFFLLSLSGTQTIELSFFIYFHGAGVYVVRVRRARKRENRRQPLVAVVGIILRIITVALLPPLPILIALVVDSFLQ